MIDPDKISENLEKARAFVLKKTYVFQDVARTFEETINFIETQTPKYENRSILVWQKTYKQFLHEMKNGLGLNSMNKEKQEEFFLSAQINDFYTKFNEEIMANLASLSGISIYPLTDSYMKCQKPQFLKAKDTLREKIPHLIEAKKTQHHLEFQKTFFHTQELKDYFGSFTFDMKNRHNGEHEQTLDKNVKFPTNADEDDTGFIFRFFDEVDEALEMVVYNQEGNISNTEEIIDKILCPRIWHGCGYCNNANHVGLNHELGLIQEWRHKICKTHANKKDTVYLKSKIATTGKLIFLNDVRDLLGEHHERERDLMTEVSRFGRENKVSTYINMWEGQQGHMACMAQLLNVGYIQAGSHGGYLKKTPTGFKVTYSNNEGDALAEIDLALWAVCFVDYEEAIKLVGSEEKLKESIEAIDCFVIDVKPGTYEVKATYKNRDKNSKDTDFEFGELNWINDETQLQPFTKEQWNELR